VTIELVPTGQPYGQRQQNEQAMRDANIPRSISETPPKPQPGPVRQVSPAQPGDINAFDLRTPDKAQFGRLQTGDSNLVQVLAASPNPLLRDLADRIRNL